MRVPGRGTVGDGVPGRRTALRRMPSRGIPRSRAFRSCAPRSRTPRGRTPRLPSGPGNLWSCRRQGPSLDGGRRGRGLGQRGRAGGAGWYGSHPGARRAGRCDLVRRALHRPWAVGRVGADLGLVGRHRQGARGQFESGDGCRRRGEDVLDQPARRSGQDGMGQGPGERRVLPGAQPPAEPGVRDDGPPPDGPLNRSEPLPTTDRGNTSDRGGPLDRTGPRLRRRSGRRSGAALRPRDERTAARAGRIPLGTRMPGGGPHLADRVDRPGRAESINPAPAPGRSGGTP